MNRPRLERLQILASRDARWLLVVGLAAFCFLVGSLTFLIAIGRAEVDDLRSLLAAVGGFFFGWLAQSPVETASRTKPGVVRTDLR